jgi:hypothetical protein
MSEAKKKTRPLNRTYLGRDNILPKEQEEKGKRKKIFIGSNSQPPENPKFPKQTGTITNKIKVLVLIF